MTRAPTDGHLRAVIEGVSPEVDCGRFPIKRVVGEDVTVAADVYCDGHDRVRAVVRYRPEGASDWGEVEMEPLVNDRWEAAFPVDRLGGWRYTVTAWVDRARTWRHDLEKKVDAGQDVSSDLLVGAELARSAAARADGAAARRLAEWAERLEESQDPADGLAEELAGLLDAFPDRGRATTYGRELPITVDPPRARFSSWYEVFPRSCGTGTTHGTFADVEAKLDHVERMGFDVLYLPPIHPIGRTHRKGRNNSPVAEPDDVGSPWGIGAEEGGHKDIHPDLGTQEDFERLVASARERGIDVALDVAFQCSPDHPWVKEHPEWFRHRPDGSIMHAENPPKKYEDIYPLDFESPDWQQLWEELRSVFLHWVGAGVRIFRVDNPHTKAFAFWEWCIAEVKRRHPDVIFLSEAFTRPKVMYRLAKLGFTQSYTYFAWRNTKWEIERYFTELTRTEVADYFRPNLWPNTPDILPEYLQYGGRAAFVSRLILAATLGANYGMYGPAFELGVSEAVAPGREEYLDSEKYEIKDWDWDSPDSLAELIGIVNRIRRENPALQQDRTLRFHPVDNDNLIAFSKASDDGDNVVLVVASVDPHHPQSGWVTLPLDDFGIDPAHPFQMHDLLTRARFLWNGATNFVSLDPHSVPAHVFRLRHRIRTEEDFDYFM